MSKTIRDQFLTAAPALLHSKIPSYAGAWKKDGVDHINIFFDAKTGGLGSRLDFDQGNSFEHPVLGTFRTLNSLMAFIRAPQPNDRLRTMVGSVLRHAADNLGRPRRVDHLRAIVMHSAYCRILNTPGLIKQMRESTLPFDHYRVLTSGIRQRIEKADWVTGGYEEIRQALKANREPEFAFLMDDSWDWRKQGQPTIDDIYRSVVEWLIPGGAAPVAFSVIAKSTPAPIDHTATTKADTAAPATKKKPRNKKKTESRPIPTAMPSPEEMRPNWVGLPDQEIAKRYADSLLSKEKAKQRIREREEARKEAKRRASVATTMTEREKLAEQLDPIFKPPIEGEGTIRLEDVTAVDTVSATIVDIFNNLRIPVPENLEEAQEGAPIDQSTLADALSKATQEAAA